MRQLLSGDEISAVLRLAEHQLWTKPPAQGWSARQTCYLSTANAFGRELPHIRSKLMAAAARVDAQHWKLLASGARKVVPRCVECHRLGSGRDVLHPGHYDHGSVLTIDVMLSRPGEDFNGGRFQTVESDGSVRAHPFERGDAIVFVSHKPHFVEAVSKGERRVLIIELWEGEERTCPHRCECRRGACVATPTVNSPSIDRM